MLFEIDLGDGTILRVAGRIDRINEVSAGQFEVLDYKTGGFWKDKWKGVFAGGTRLQHALYGLAAVELLKTRNKKATIVGGTYYFSSRKGRLEHVRIPAPGCPAIAAMLADLREVILEGEFVRTPDESNCRYCDYAAACSANSNQQAKAKLSDPTLQAYQRLGAHV